MDRFSDMAERVAKDEWVVHYENWIMGVKSEADAAKVSEALEEDRKLSARDREKLKGKLEKRGFKASRVAGAGVSPEQLYRRIRGGLLGIARDMGRRFGRDQVNLRYGKSELSGTVAGHDVRVFYEVLRASNGETAGLPVLFVDGTKYARFYRNVDEKLAEIIGTPVTATRVAGGALSQNEVKPYLYKPAGDYWFEKKSDGLYLTFYSADDAHQVFGRGFDGRFEREEVKGRPGQTTYRITRKVASRTAANVDIGRVLGRKFVFEPRISSGSEWMVYKYYGAPGQERNPGSMTRLRREVERALDEERVDYRSMEVRTDGRERHGLDTDIYVIIEGTM